MKEVIFLSNLSVCGTICEECYCYGKMCSGCNECEGKVFHASEGKACSIYECAVNQNKLESCGVCSKIPCKIWLETRDPKFSDEEFEANINARINALKSQGTLT